MRRYLTHLLALAVLAVGTAVVGYAQSDITNDKKDLRHDLRDRHNDRKDVRQDQRDLNREWHGYKPNVMITSPTGSETYCLPFAR